MHKALETGWLGATLGVALAVPIKLGIAPTKRPATYTAAFLLTFVAMELGSMVVVGQLYARWDASRWYRA